MKIIQNALKKGDLHTRDFSKTPLPILPSEEKNESYSDVYISEQERNNRDKRKGRFADGPVISNAALVRANIEELATELKVIVRII
jgi:hypothetical protein